MDVEPNSMMLNVIGKLCDDISTPDGLDACKDYYRSGKVILFLAGIASFLVLVMPLAHEFGFKSGAILGLILYGIGFILGVLFI